MNQASRALSAEMLKLRRTLALRVSIATPLALVVLMFAVYARRPPGDGGADPLIGFAQINFTMWTVVLLPLYIALIGALVAGVDHQSDGWKHLLALPLPRWSVFAAKWTSAAGLLLMSTVVFTIAVCGAAAALTAMTPAWHNARPLPLDLVVTRALQTACGAFLALSLQLWISLRWKNFIPGLVVGALAMMVLLGGVARAPAGSVEVYLYPWALPPIAMARMAEWHPDRVPVSVGGLIAGIVFAAIACGRLARREMA